MKNLGIGNFVCKQFIYFGYGRCGVLCDLCLGKWVSTNIMDNQYMFLLCIVFQRREDQEVEDKKNFGYFRDLSVVG